MQDIDHNFLSTGIVVCSSLIDDCGNFDLGTHCAGIAASTLHGVAKGAFVVPVKVLDSRGEGTSASVLSGFAWAIEDAKKHGSPAVLSLSFAAPYSEAVNEAMEQFHDEGVERWFSLRKSIIGLMDGL